MIPILARSTSLSAGALTLALTSTAAQAAPFVATADQCPKVEELSPAERARARCGLLEVPENPTLPLGRQVKLKVAIVEPPGGKPNDPVVMIHGGPGFGWVELYRSRFAGAFGPRTVIMFDQRGVGLSEPRLCPALSGAVFDASTRGLSAREETARVVAANKACHDSLIAGGFDLTRYNTAATVADMEVLRAALGFEKWNLYGASYGTSVGLAYLAAHPERIRTLILDSVYPLDRQPAANVVVNMLRSLHELALVCAAQPACSARYGDIESLFTRALASLVDNRWSSRQWARPSTNPSR